MIVADLFEFLVACGIYTQIEFESYFVFSAPRDSYNELSRA